MEYCQTDFVMAKSGKQTETGKAFEYACAYVLYKQYSKITNVVLLDSPQMSTARNAFNNLTMEEQRDYILGAEAAVRIVDRLEPKL